MLVRGARTPGASFLAICAPGKPWARSLSKKNDDGVSLADALNLLSPQKDTKPIEYQPSLFDTWRNGPVNEKFSKSSDLQLQFKIPSSETKKHLDHLLAGLNVFSTHSVSSVDLLTSPPHVVSRHIRAIGDEAELVKICRLLYYQDKLTYPLLFDIVFNKNLVHLDQLPVDVTRLSPEQLPHWPQESFLRWNIVMMKKYYDQKKPLQIVKNLRDNFDSQYLPSIKQGILSPFYERTVWRFHHQFFKLTSTLGGMHDVKSDILLWEVIKDGQNLAKKLSGDQRLVPLQRLFFKISSSELPAAPPGAPDPVRQLRQISIKNKLHALHLADCEDVGDRELMALQTFAGLEKVLAGAGNDALLAELRSLRDLSVENEEWFYAPA